MENIMAQHIPPPPPIQYAAEVKRSYSEPLPNVVFTPPSKVPNDPSHHKGVSAELSVLAMEWVAGIEPHANIAAKYGYTEDQVNEMIRSSPLFATYIKDAQSLIEQKGFGDHTGLARKATVITEALLPSMFALAHDPNVDTGDRITIFKAISSAATAAMKQQQVGVTSQQVVQVNIGMGVRGIEPNNMVVIDHGTGGVVNE
jgi:hypothetical protein